MEEPDLVPELAGGRVVQGNLCDPFQLKVFKDFVIFGLTNTG